MRARLAELSTAGLLLSIFGVAHLHAQGAEPLPLKTTRAFTARMAVNPPID